MTSTDSRPACQLLKKYGAEIMPSTAYKRCERVRSFSSSSFKEIEESEEEEQVHSPCSSQSTRSPFALTDSPVTLRRNSSLMQNALLSPKFMRRAIPPKLNRGLSDSQLVRPLVVRRIDSNYLYESRKDSLPSIPETSTSSQNDSHVEQNEKDKD